MKVVAIVSVAALALFAWQSCPVSAGDGRNITNINGSVHASSGESVVRPLALVLLYDAIVGLLAYAVCEHALTD